MSEDETIEAILDVHRRISTERSTLIAISGIDASGKGYLTAKFAESLQSRGVRVAVLHADAWLNLPHVRFNPQNPAEHFYRHAYRFPELFSDIVLPLRNHRSLQVEANVAEETSMTFRSHIFSFEEVDIVLLEGIFLFQPDLLCHYDLSIWVDCSYATALGRAIIRRQENLGPIDTTHLYQTVFFPAQKIHLERDDPRTAADIVLNNDPNAL